MTPVRLHEQMAKMGAERLGNVKIYDTRRTRQDNDEDVGRKKIIVTSLYENGLINHPLGKRKEWNKLQKKQAAEELKLQQAIKFQQQAAEEMKTQAAEQSKVQTN
jgi:hypothetical protein